MSNPDAGNANSRQKGPHEGRIVLRRGLILVDPDDPRVVEHGATVLDRGRIVAVNAADLTPDPGDTVVDCSGCLIMPGLVNAHCHSPMSLLRGAADDLPLDRWLHECIFPVEARHVNQDFVRCGAMLAAAEMALGGITTVADGYFHMEAAASAFADVGIRGVMAQGVLDVPTPDAGEPGSWRERAAAFFESFPDDPLVRPALFCHSPYLCSPETYAEAAELVSGHDGLLFTHVAETEGEVEHVRERYSAGPVEHLNNMGLLGRGLVTVHGVHITEREIDLLAETATGMVHCPESNMKLAGGAAPVTEMLSRGVPLAVGTDGPASNNNLDIFEEMRSASLMAKLVTRDPVALPASAALRMGLTGGAEVLGMEEEIGSLEAGKLADIIVLDLSGMHLTPMYDAVSHLVYSAGASDVRDVFVAGRWIVRERRLTTVDEDEIKESARAFSREIADALGTESYSPD